MALSTVVRPGTPWYYYPYALAVKLPLGTLALFALAVVLATACLVASAASSLWTFPHSLAYFNELAGGPQRGIDRLIDWNLDASQDLFYLKPWYDKHPEARPFHLAYYGSFDARMAGFEFSLPPTCPHGLQNMSFMPQPEHGPLPGWHAVSVNVVCGFGWWFYDGTSDKTRRIQNECYACFRRFRPVATAGYSIHIYKIDCAQANEVRRQLGMPLIPCDDAPAGR